MKGFPALSWLWRDFDSRVGWGGVNTIDPAWQFVIETFTFLLNSQMQHTRTIQSYTSAENKARTKQKDFVDFQSLSELFCLWTKTIFWQRKTSINCSAFLVQPSFPWFCSCSVSAQRSEMFSLRWTGIVLRNNSSAFNRIFSPFSAKHTLFLNTQIPSRKTQTNCQEQNSAEYASTFVFTSETTKGNKECAQKWMLRSRFKFRRADPFPIQNWCQWNVNTSQGHAVFACGRECCTRGNGGGDDTVQNGSDNSSSSCRKVQSLRVFFSTGRGDVTSMTPLNLRVPKDHKHPSTNKLWWPIPYYATLRSFRDSKKAPLLMPR